MTTLVVVHRDDPSSRLALEVGLDLLRGEVVAVTVGGAEHDDALREAVAAGAHRAIRLTGPNGDTTSGVADAALLAPLVDELRPKLTLLGARRGRLGTYGAGPALAELTGLAHVGAVSSVRQVDDRFQVQRRREGDLETIRCPIPAVLSIEWGNSLRYPTLPGRLRARRSKISVLAAGPTFEPGVSIVRRTGPKPRRKLEQRTAPGFDHVLGLLLGGTGGGGGDRQLSGDPEDVAPQVVDTCARVLEGVR